MPEIHLRQSQFTYSACGPFTKHEQRIQKFKETGYKFKSLKKLTLQTMCTKMN